MQAECVGKNSRMEGSEIMTEKLQIQDKHTMEVTIGEKLSGKNLKLQSGKKEEMGDGGESASSMSTQNVSTKNANCDTQAKYAKTIT